MKLAVANRAARLQRALRGCCAAGKFLGRRFRRHAPYCRVDREEKRTTKPPVFQGEISKPRIFNRTRRIAVRVTSLENPGPRPSNDLLDPPPRRSRLRCDVLDKPKPAARTQDANYFREHLVRLSYCTQHKRCDDLVDGLIGKRYLLAARGQQFETNALLHGIALQASVHRDTRFDCDQVAICGEIAKIRTGACTKLDNSA